MRQSHPPADRSNNRVKKDPVSRYLWIAFLVSAVLTVFLAFRSCRTASPDPSYRPSGNQPTQAGATEDPAADLDNTRPLQLNANRPGKVELDMDEIVYVLFTGLDIREWEQDTGPGLTDTMILAALDPEQGTAALMSLPRDLWVELPGFGHYKINQAYMVGEWKAYPGGGPALMMETVGDLLGIQIDYYVQVNFDAFVALVDAVDGVVVDVQERILVDPDPSRDGDMKMLKPGLQKLPGDLTLGYVRTRSTDEGDFGRAKRQQQVLRALQKKVFTYQILPRLIRSLPSLSRDLAEDVETNLTMKQIATLGWAARDIDPAQLDTVVLSPPLVTAGFNNQGQYILTPDIASIRTVWEDLLEPSAAPIPQVSPTAVLSQSQLVENENAAVAVLNGTTTPGLAGSTAAYLRDQGLRVTRVENAEQYSEQTLVYDYSGKPDTLRVILNKMNLTRSRLFHRSDPSVAEDIVIVLGADWAAENSLPEE